MVGPAGRRIVREHLSHVMETNAVDLLIVNGENAAGGFGITPPSPRRSSTWARMSSPPATTSGTRRRYSSTWPSPPTRTRAAAASSAPPTTPSGTPGFGVYEGELPTGQPYAVVNLQGRVFMSTCDDPFRMADALLAKLTAKVILVDFHGEATSEKVALGWYLDGRVTAVLGTHTHVPTADERLLHNGTAYQTDVGMCGSFDSVIGVETELVLHRFLTGMPGKFEPAKGNPKMCATLVECDGSSGRANAIRRILLGE